MWTVGDVITQAREVIQDKRAPYRNSDTELLGYFNHALSETRRLRPDLFLGNEEEARLLLWTTQVTDLDEPFPLEEQYFSPFVFFVSAMVGVGDDEFANNGRAAGLMTMFKTQLVGTGATS